jgi:hypothetical protein
VPYPAKPFRAGHCVAVPRQSVPLYFGSSFNREDIGIRA